MGDEVVGQAPRETAGTLSDNLFVISVFTNLSSKKRFAGPDLFGRHQRTGAKVGSRRRAARRGFLYPAAESATGCGAAWYEIWKVQMSWIAVGRSKSEMPWAIRVCLRMQTKTLEPIVYNVLKN